MSEWRTASLRELADIRVSNVDKKTSPGERAVRLCNYMDVYSNDYIRANLPFMEASATAAEVGKFKVERGDVLITKDSETPDDIGIPAVVVDEIDDLVCGYHLALIKPNRKFVDPVFLSKQLSTAETTNYFSRYAAGSTRYGLSNGAIANTRISFPALPQQQKIAAILTSIDAAIEKTEALIGKYQHIKAGLMHDLFTRGVLPNGTLRPPRTEAPELYQQTALGWIPREWKVARAGDLCSLITKGTTPSSSDMWEGQDGVRFLRVDNLSFDGQFNFDASSYRISTQTHTVLLARSMCVPGDVLMNIVGPPLGKVALVTQNVGDININQAIAIFRPKAELSSLFLLRWLISDSAKRWILQRAKQTSGQLNVTLAMCQDLALPHMSIAEQQRIEARIQGAELLVQSESNRRAKLQRQKLGLMQDLLTGKVPVKVASKSGETVDV